MSDPTRKRMRDLTLAEWAMFLATVAMAVIFAYWWWTHNARYHAAVANQKEKYREELPGGRPCPDAAVVQPDAAG